ncbi:hypothetical protein ACBJ59_61350 [Nonomuraea sp. MTCD27]|uniref:hypothetical protein n=1 Tax=Nonomuraea sp. MTCD27 TaxID=1676747 RepID=UPI0035BF814E
MADRTVTTRLKLGITEWTSGSNTVKRDLRDLNTRFKESAGAASGFRKKLEEATARLPKIEIDANSSAAERKFAQLRQELEQLSRQQIGVDIDAVDAMAELDLLKAELGALEDGASFEVRAGIQQAIADLEMVAAEARRLDGTDVKISIDADSNEALGDIGKISAGLIGLGAAVPIIASVAAGAGILQGALFSAGAGAQLFGTVATATLERVQTAVDSQDYSKLSPEEFQLAQGWQEFSDVYLKWQQSLNPDVVPAITGGLGLMEKTLPKISPLVAGTANSFVGLEQRAAAALDGPFWTKFLHNVGVAGPQAMTGLGNSALNVVTGVAGIMNAFMPWQGTVVGGIEDATAKFSAWGQALESNQQFQQFMAYVQEHAPEAWELVKNLAGALLNVGEAVVPLGVGSMAGINLLAQIVAGMDPQHIQLIALAILAIKTAQAGLAVAGFFTEMPGRLGTLRDGLDKAKTSAGKFGDVVSGLGDKVGGLAGALAGGAAVTGGLILLEQWFSKNAEAAGRFTEKVAALGGSGIDGQIASLTAEIEKLKATLGPSLFDTVYLTNEQARTADQIEAMEQKVADLRHQKELDAIASRTSGDAVATMGGQVATAAGNVDTLRGAISQLVGLQGNAMQAEISYKRALDETAAAIRENGKATSTNSEAGRANREVLIGLAEKANAYRQALIDQGTPLDQVTEKLGRQREAFITTAEKMGFSRTEAKKLADQLGLIPGNVSTTTKTPGGKEALALMREYQKKLNELDGKTVTTTIIQQTFDRKQSVGKQDKLKAAQGALVQYAAAGGITGYASGGMRPHIVSKPTAIVYGEGSSGRGAREAFIPLDEYRPQAIDLLADIADRFGFSLYGKQAGQQVHQVAVTVSDAATQLGAQLGDVDISLTSAFGDTGTLTGALDGVSAAGAAMAAGWEAGADLIGDNVGTMGTVVSSAVTLMTTETTKSVDGLTGSIQDLAVAVAAAKMAAAKKDGTGHLLEKETAPRGISAAQKAKMAKGAAKNILEAMGITGGTVAGSNPEDMIAGHDAGSLFYDRASAFTQTSPVNSARVSAPQQATWTPAAVAAAVAAAAAGATSQAASSRNGAAYGGGQPAVQVDMSNSVIREEADIDRLGARFGSEYSLRGPV